MGRPLWSPEALHVHEAVVTSGVAEAWKAGTDTPALGCGARW